MSTVFSLLFLLIGRPSRQDIDIVIRKAPPRRAAKIRVSAAEVDYTTQAIVFRAAALGHRGHSTFSSTRLIETGESGTL